MLKQFKNNSIDLTEKGREELAQKEKEEIEVIQKYLPEQMSEEKLKEIISEIVSQTGASSMKDMGKVMGLASKKLAGSADGKTISTMVKAMLLE